MVKAEKTETNTARTMQRAWRKTSRVKGSEARRASWNEGVHWVSVLGNLSRASESFSGQDVGETEEDKVRVGKQRWQQGSLPHSCDIRGG